MVNYHRVKSLFATRIGWKWSIKNMVKKVTKTAMDPTDQEFFVFWQLKKILLKLSADIFVKRNNTRNKNSSHFG